MIHNIHTVSKACEPVSHCKVAERCVGCLYYPVWAGNSTTSSQLCTVSSDSEGSELDYRKYLRFAKISESPYWLKPQRSLNAISRCEIGMPGAKLIINRQL